MNNRSDDVNFEASLDLAIAMLDVVKQADNVGQGLDAVGILLAFYLHCLREAGVITPDDAVTLAGVVQGDVVARLAASLPPAAAGVQ